MQNNQNTPTPPISWRDRYTPDQLVIIDQHWHEPPKQCTGNCQIKHNWEADYCNGCSWDNLGTDGLPF